MKEKWKDQKGFTLMEMIIVIGILAILCGLVTAGISGYLHAAYSTRVNDTAKTVFLAAQNYLTEQKQLGRLSEFNEKKDGTGTSYAKPVTEEWLKEILKKNFTSTADAADFDAYYADYAAEYGVDTVAYILLEDENRGGSDREDNPIYQIVDTYLDDHDILAHTFLMEYDTKTGVVRAVFYTEKAETLSYTTGETDADNVILRDAESCSKKGQGYYGVDATSTSHTDVELLGPKNVMLINGERLYLQWQEANYLSPADIRDGYTADANDYFSANPDLKEYLTYEVQVYKNTGGTEELLASFDGITGERAGGSTIAQAESTAAADDIVLAFDEDTNTYRLVLDDIDRSILKQIPSVQPEDYIYCRVVERLLNHRDYTGEETSLGSNSESVMFAGGDEKWSLLGAAGAESIMMDVGGNGHVGDTAENGIAKESAYSVANARHLNNMRYADGTACVVLTADIDWAVPETDRADGAYQRNKTAFAPLEFQTVSAGYVLPGTAFNGMFFNEKTGDDAFVISNLFITETDEKNVGMFRQIGAAGSVEDICLKNPTVKAGYLSGILAGSSSGTITGVKISKGTLTAAAYAGGITGYNYGTITACEVQAALTGTDGVGLSIEAVTAKEEPSAGYYIGGITGVNRGSITDTSSSTKGQKGITGIAYVGGIAGANCGSIKNAAAGKTGESQTVTGVYCVGGIAGANGFAFAGEETGASIKASKSAIYIASRKREDGGLLTETDGLAAGKNYGELGGIAGFNGTAGVIADCRSQAPLFMDKLIQDKIIQDKQTESEAENTGRVEPAYISNIGGIAGDNAGEIRQCSYAIEKADASALTALQKECVTATADGTLPMYAGVNVGGIVGFNEAGAKVTACGVSNQAVAGYQNVGGIIGKNQGILQAGDAGTVSGLVLASDCAAGGIVGNNEQTSLKGFTNQADVFAGSLAGGIVAANGGMGDYVFTAERTDASGNFLPEYYEKLLNPEFTGAADSAKNPADMVITDCGNQGFVYVLKRYAGGVAGINYGTIEKTGSVVRISDALSDLMGGSIESLAATADCVGGIAGANFGIIDKVENYAPAVEVEKDGISSQIRLYSYVCGNDFTGGIAGINTGTVENIPVVYGKVYAAGSFTGGVIGLNTNAAFMKKVVLTDDMQVTGDYFVGGIIGMNATGENLKITGLAVNSTQKQACITGTAYAGGILGYNTSLPASGEIKELYENEIAGLIAQAFAPYKAADDVAVADNTTVFKNCYNYANVCADRYVGGILGYNSPKSPLYIIDSINYGRIEIKDAAKTTDGNYLIGGITGRNSASGVIHGCINDGTVKSPSAYLGGICEVNEGWIQFCTVGKSKNYDTAEDSGIVGEHSVGGLVGLNRGRVVQCVTSSFAKISGGDNTGGIVGTNDAYSQIPEDKAVGAPAVISGDGSLAKEIPGEINPAGSACVSSGSVSGGNNTGGIAGLNLGSVEKVSVKCKEVKGKVYVGGFIGANEGKIGSGSEKIVISDLVNEAKSVIGQNEVGGIVGKHNASIIRNCVNYGNVSIQSGYVGNAGGITGSVADGIILENCTNYGTIQADAYGSYAGGISGVNDGIIRECVNGTVKEEEDTYYGQIGTAISEASDAGGIAAKNNALIENCINEGSVMGAYKRGGADTAIGGIAGLNTKKGTIKNGKSISNGIGTYGSNSITGEYIAGGIVGYDAGEIDNDAEWKNVTISMRKNTQNITDATCSIGGVAGYAPKGEERTYSDYTYTGKIEVTSGGTQGQLAAGGILGICENGVTIDNCTFAGEIKGYGNSGAKGGIGAIAGSAAGTIIVHKDADGYYSAAADTAVVEGRYNVGGLVGLVNEGFVLCLDSTEKVLENLAVNHDADQTNDVFYTNRATVCGSRNTGGVYGNLYGYGTVLSHYENRGTVKPNDAVAETHESIGGILGTTENITNKFLVSKNFNYGTIGYEDMDSYPTSRTTQYVGGIVGRASGNYGIEITDVANYGHISCGTTRIGAIAGFALGNNDSDKKVLISGVTNFGVIDTLGSDVGGIVGYMEKTTVTDSTNQGTLTYHNTALKPETPIGGIAGEMRNASIISCRNEAEIDAKNAGRVGGIVGYLNAAGNNTVKNCVNGTKEKQSVTVQAQQDVAGIVGALNGSTASAVVTVEKNTNYMTITAKYRSGGIIGYLQGMVPSKEWTLTACTNYGVIAPALVGKINNHAISEHGGCIGRMDTLAQVNDFTNYGTILLNASDAAGIWNLNDSVSGMQSIGGIAGLVEVKNGYNAEKLVNCTNYGAIRLENNGSKTFDARYFGGIAGSISGVKENTCTVIKDCTNKGELSVAADAPLYNIKQWGGVAGNLIKSASGAGGGEEPILAYCVNEGRIDVTSQNTAEKSVEDIGGIAGFLGEEVKIAYCTAKNSVLTSEKNGTDVGGVVGESKGLIYGCATTWEQSVSKERPLVEGLSRVGGILGNNAGITGKLSGYYDERTKEESLIINTFDVTAGNQAGGIVGCAESITMEDCINSADTTVTLLGRMSQKDTDIKYLCAGGIAGFASETDASFQSVMVNCYSFGQVRFAKDYDKTYYVGGIIGYRGKLKKAGQTAPAVEIKDCYYLGDEAHPFVDESKPEPQNAQKYEVLAIGNEPEVAYAVADGDLMSGADDLLRTEARFRLSEERYRTLYGIIHGMSEEELKNIDTSVWDQMDAVVENIIRHYNQYKLPVPETTGVTAGAEGYDYVLGIKNAAGFYENLKYYLYISDEVEAKIGETVEADEIGKAFASGTKNIDMDKQLTDLAIGSERTLKGKEGAHIKVALQAMGVEKDGVVYSIDSDVVVVREFIVMPALPEPQIVFVEQEDYTVTLRMTNWEEYQKSAGEVYESIKKNVPDWENIPYYRALVDGLNNFYVEDYYQTKSGSEKDKKDTFTIEKSQIAADGTFTIDYSQKPLFTQNKSGRQYHTWNMQAVALHSAGDDYWSVEKDAVLADADNTRYRYTNSQLKQQKKFLVRAEISLDPATELSGTYIGGTACEDADTPSYRLTFTESASPVEAIDHYEIVVENPANQKTYTTTYVPEAAQNPDASPGVAEILLDKAALLETLEVNLEPGSAPQELKYTVQVKKNDSEAATFFLDSAVAESTVTVIKKGYLVDEVTCTAGDGENLYQWIWQWTDSHASDGDVYQLSWVVRNGTAESEPVVLTTTEKTFALDVSDSAQFAVGCTIELSVMRLGSSGQENADTKETVMRLDSDWTAGQAQKGETLPAVTNIQTVFDRIEGSNLIYRVTFDIPEYLTAENCRGFVLEQMAPQQNEILGEAAEIAFDAALPVEISIPIENNAGKVFYTKVTTVPVLAVSRGTEEVGNLLAIPSEQLAAPTDITADITGGNTVLSMLEATDENSFTKKEYDAASVVFGWHIEGNNIKQQHLTLVLPAEGERAEEILWEAASGNSKESMDLDAVLSNGKKIADYAGKTLLLRIYNEPRSTDISLPSDVTQITLYVPKYRLCAPQINGAGIKRPVTDEGGNISWEQTDAQTAVLESEFENLRCLVDWSIPDVEENEPVSAFELTITAEQIQYDEDGNPRTDEDTGEPLTETVTVNDFAVQINRTTEKEITAKDGVAELLWSEADGKSGQLIVTGIAKDYAQARLTVHIRCLADTNEKTAWTASAETTLELQLPPVIEEEREPDDENSLTE